MFHYTQLNKSKWPITALVYFGVVFLFYKNTVGSKFIFDWNSWMVHYINEGWSGLVDCYGDKSMRWGYHLINMILWKTFNLNSLGWFFTCIMLHTINGLSLSFLAYKLLHKTSIKDSFPLAVAIGIIWLISPYHSETVVWGATTLFLAMTFQVLTGLILFLRYIETLEVKTLFAVYIFFLLAMFTFEAFVPFPLLLLALWLITGKSVGSKLTLKEFLLRLFLPMVFFIILYFIGNKLRIGNWVGHYGESSHLNTDINLIIPNLSKYLLKLLYVPLWFSFQQRDAVYAFLENRLHVLIALAFYLSVAVSLVYWFNKSETTRKLPIGLLLMFVIALLPVINLYFMYYKDIEQDRYVYFASPFFYAALLVALYLILQRWAILPFVFLLLISAKFLIRNNYCWSESGRIANSLMKDFRWEKSKRVFVLLTPDDFNGAYCMRSMPNSTLAEMLYVQRGIDMGNRIKEVYQYNVTSAQDSAICHVLDSATLQLKLVTGGGWLWKNSFGANDFETTEFKASLNKWYPWYTITFKNKQTEDVFIYPARDRWLEVKNF